MRLLAACTPQRVAEFIRGDAGVALAEYAVIAATLAMAMLAMLTLMTTETGTQLTSTGTNLDGVGLTPP